MNTSENVDFSFELPPATPLRVEGRYLFAGTVVWARNYEQWSMLEDGSTDYAFPFRGLDTFERDKYDAWFADFECASSEAQPVSIERAREDLVFNCNPDFLSEASNYFDFFTLANNHTYDLGIEGFAETQQLLQKNGIQHAGNFDPGILDDVCEVVALPIRVVYERQGREFSKNRQLPMAVCAWHYFFRLPQSAEIEAMKQYAEIMPVMAFVQAGPEYQAQADPVQVSIARAIAEYEPMFIVMNSSHWVQNGEVINGVPVLYSAGNFIFDQQWNEELMRSVSLEAMLSFEYSPDIERWLELGPRCAEFKDSCLEDARLLEKPMPRPKKVFDVVGGDGRNQITVRADEELQKIIEDRVGWSSMLSALGQQ